MNKRGFTLIEVLIVVAIIGILASIVVVGLGAFRGRARDTRRISDLRQTQNALELYYTRNGQYPAAANWTALQTALTSIATIPNDPTPGATYQYTACNSNQNYALRSDLEDTSNPALNDSARTGTCPTALGCSTANAYCVQL